MSKKEEYKEYYKKFYLFLEKKGKDRSLLPAVRTITRDDFREKYEIWARRAKSGEPSVILFGERHFTNNEQIGKQQIILDMILSEFQEKDVIVSGEIYENLFYNLALIEARNPSKLTNFYYIIKYLMSTAPGVSILPTSITTAMREKTEGRSKQDDSRYLEDMFRLLATHGKHIVVGIFGINHLYHMSKLIDGRNVLVVNTCSKNGTDDTLIELSQEYIFQKNNELIDAFDVINNNFPYIQFENAIESGTLLFNTISRLRIQDNKHLRELEMHYDEIMYSTMSNPNFQISDKLYRDSVHQLKSNLAHFPIHKTSLKVLSIGDSVVIIGIKAQPELNGKIGIVTTEMNENGRWGVSIDGNVKSLKSDNLIKFDDKKLSIGDSVVIIGIKAQPELNGKIGIVTTEMNENGRWGVSIDGNVKSLKSDNLIKYVDHKKEGKRIRSKNKNRSLRRPKSKQSCKKRHMKWNSRTKRCNKNVKI